MSVNYGIQASECGHNPGAALWDWVAASNNGLVLFLETGFEYPGGLEDKTLCGTRVSTAGHVMIDPEHPEETLEFGRYLPQRKGTFIRICDRCMCRNQTLVAPATKKGPWTRFGSPPPGRTVKKVVRTRFI